MGIARSLPRHSHGSSRRGLLPRLVPRRTGSRAAAPWPVRPCCTLHRRRRGGAPPRRRRDPPADPCRRVRAGAGAGDRRLTGELRSCQVEAMTPVCVSVADVARELRLDPAPGRRRARPRRARRRRGRAPAHPRPRPRVALAALPAHRGREPVGGPERPHLRDARPRRRQRCRPRARRVQRAPQLPARAARARREFAALLQRGLRPRDRSRQAEPELAARRRAARVCELDRAPEFAVWARDGGAFPDSTHQWWDLRLSGTHGTIEVRVADTQTRVDDAATLIAFIQSLVCELAPLRAGEPLPVHREERMVENAWLATRDGIGGHLVDLETGDRVWTAERLGDMASRLTPRRLARLRPRAARDRAAGPRRRWRRSSARESRRGIDALLPHSPRTRGAGRRKRPRSLLGAALAGRRLS